MDESAERVFEILPADRSSALGLFIFAPIALVGFFGYGLYRILSGNVAVGQSQALAWFSVCFLLIVPPILLQFRRAKRLDWFRGRIRVTNKQITWESPSIHGMTARWSDLRYVSQNTLYFGEEIALPLGFGPTRYGQMKKEAITQIVEVSGPHPLLQAAYGDSQLAAGRERFLTILSAVMALLLMLAYFKFSEYVDLSRRIRLWGLVLAFYIGLLPIIVIRIQRFRTAKKFHPPRDARSRYKFPWS